MSYPNYLIHYNKNHSKADGRFVSGDGDGDGIINDNSAKKDEKKARRNAIIGTAAAATVTTGLAALMIADAVNSKRTSSGKSFADDYTALSLSEAKDWARRMGGLSIG